MAIRQLNPYLNYDGDAAKAAKFYERALDAKIETLSLGGDMPGATPENKDRVIHGRLTLGEKAVIMMSDAQPGVPLVTGNNNYVCLDFDDVADMEQKFTALAEGGKVGMPLQDTFWGARFGFLTDAFGVNWMFNCELKKG
jgi:PhnB protein